MTFAEVYVAVALEAMFHFYRGAVDLDNSSTRAGFVALLEDLRPLPIFNAMLAQWQEVATARARTVVAFRRPAPRA